MVAKSKKRYNFFHSKDCVMLQLL